MKSTYHSCAAMVALLVSMCIVGCSTAPKDDEKRDALVDQGQATLKEMKAHDSSLQGFIDRGHGYVIFPNVGKGGLGVGGAYGRGVVYRGNQMVGYSDLSQASIGLQAGGQEFAELIVFENENTFNKFTTGQFELGANASAVALKAGAAASAGFKNGIAVFVMPKGGLMFEVSISGQKFKYQPK